MTIFAKLESILKVRNLDLGMKNVNGGFEYHLNEPIEISTEQGLDLLLLNKRRVSRNNFDI